LVFTVRHSLVIFLKRLTPGIFIEITKKKSQKLSLSLFFLRNPANSKKKMEANYCAHEDTKRFLFHWPNQIPSRITITEEDFDMTPLDFFLNILRQNNSEELTPHMKYSAYTDNSETHEITEVPIRELPGRNISVWIVPAKNQYKRGYGAGRSEHFK
jgi:hypothetical protein